MQGHFGSDGYRGVIGHSLTKAKLGAITAGIVDFVKSVYNGIPSETCIPVGFDTRFLAQECGSFVCRILENEGFNPELCYRPCPSPYLAFAARHLDSPIGIQVTASHNPYYYGGVKLKGQHGGSLLPGDVKKVQQLANQADPARWDGLPLIAGTDTKTFNVDKQYTSALLDASGGSSDLEQRLVVDFMHGSAAGIYRDILKDLYNVNTELRSNPDPMFEGAKPEPLPRNLEELAARVKFDGFSSIGIAFDGDGDRLAVADETGAFLEPHEIYCLLLEYIVQELGYAGPVVGTVSFSGLVKRCATKMGLSFVEVPVGFKSVSEAMLEHQAIIGGEESGGTGFGHYLPERDALLMALLILGSRLKEGIALSEMVKRLYTRYGQSAFVHGDYKLPVNTDAADYRKNLAYKVGVSHIAGKRVLDRDMQDGVKLKLDDSWILVRVSGTEELIRVYIEAPDETFASELHEAVLKLLKLDKT